MSVTYRFLALLLIAPTSLWSQSTDSPTRTVTSETVETEFFGFKTNSLQRLQHKQEAAGFSIGDPFHRPPGSEFWWMPASGRAMFVANNIRNEMVFYRINFDSAEVTRIGSVDSKRYIDVRGHDATVYLLRVDTADNRWRLITDVYSVAQQRLVATRTLIDLPRLPTKFVSKILWDDRLQSVAISLNHHPGVSGNSHQVHVVSLQSGWEHKPNVAYPDARVPEFAKMVPLGFDASGHRIFLWQRQGDTTVPSGRLYQFTLETGELKSIGADSLPQRAPIRINHDASVAVFADRSAYEIWRTKNGQMAGAISRSSNEFSGAAKPLIEFVGNGVVLAISDGKYLRLFSGFSALSSDTAATIHEHQVHPSDAVSPGADFGPVYLSGHADTIFHFGGFTTSIPDRGPHGPWMQRIEIEFPGQKAGGVRATPLRRNRHVSLPTNEWTAWALGPTYQQLFDEITSRGKYPVSVFGRLRNGKMEFRGRFFDRPEGLEFASSHGIVEETLQRQSLHHRARRLREVWRHSFIDQSGTMRFNVIWQADGDARGRSKNRTRGRNRK